MTYLGLDLGSKTIGVSKSDSGIIAHTLTTLRFKENDYEEAVRLTLSLIKREEATKIILGLPKHMNNDLGIRGMISQEFAKKLIEHGIDVELWDERLSTQSAMKTMIKANEKRSKQKEKKDELAAVLILQNYLDYKGAYHVTR